MLLNNDTVVPPGWLETLAAPFAQFPKAALSGPEGGCCHLLPNFHGTMGPFEYLEGACLMAKREILLKFGLFPPELSGAYGEDSYLSLRMRELGFSLHRVKLALQHVRGATSARVPQAKQWQEKNHVWLRKRWGHYIKPTVRKMEYPIILRRADAWGDVLLVTPIIRALRKHRPMSPIWVETNCGDVFRDNPNVAKVEKIVRTTPDALSIDLNMAYESMQEINIVDAYAKKVFDAVGGEFEVADRRPDLTLRLTDNVRIQYQPGKKVIAIHPGPVHWRSKEWGIEKFQKVARALTDMGWTIVVVGNVKGAPILPSIDLRGQTTLHQLASVLGSVDLFLGLDSFPLHVAQAMGTPAIGIFGITTSKYILTADNAVGIDAVAETAGLRHRTLDSREVDDAGAAIRTITVEEVVNKVKEFVV